MGREDEGSRRKIGKERNKNFGREKEERQERRGKMEKR